MDQEIPGDVPVAPVPDEFQYSYLPYSPAQAKRGSDLENLIQWVLNPEEILETLEHNLRGQRPGEKKGEWKSFGPPLLNDEGIANIMGMVVARINKVVTMTNLTERIIFEEMFYFAQDLRNDFFCNFEDYDIQFRNLTKVCQIVKIMVHSGLLQAKDAGARNTWSKIQRVTTQIYQDKSKQGRSWIPGQFTPG